MMLVLHSGAVADLTATGDTATGDWYESQRKGLGLDFAGQAVREPQALAGQSEPVTECLERRPRGWQSIAARPPTGPRRRRR